MLISSWPARNTRMEGYPATWCSWHMACSATQSTYACAGCLGVMTLICWRGTQPHGLLRHAVHLRMHLGLWFKGPWTLTFNQVSACRSRDA